MTVLPTVSVAILNHNYGRYLRQAIDSALNQQPGPYHLVEVAVVDDGSTDDSLDVCTSYRDDIRVVAQPHAGFGATLTNAIKHARGEWVALLDADDWFTPDKLATVATAMTNDSLLVQHWEHVTDAAGGPLLNRPHPGGNTSTLVVRRRAALDLLPVTNEAFFHVLDHVGRGVTLACPLVHYRVHDANMTDRTNPGVFQDYLRGVNLAIASRLRTLAASPPAWVTSRVLRRLAWHYTATAAGNAREAAVQCRHRLQAATSAVRAVFLAAIARRGITDAFAGARSAIAMQLMRPTG